MNVIPDEVLVNILQFLDVKDVCHFGSTSKHNYHVSCDNKVWKLKLIKEFPWIRQKNFSTITDFKAYFLDVIKICDKVCGYASSELPCIDQELVDNCNGSYFSGKWFIKDELPYVFSFHESSDNYKLSNNHPETILHMIMFDTLNEIPRLFLMRTGNDNVTKFNTNYNNPIGDLASIAEINEFLVNNNYREFNHYYELSNETFWKAKSMGIITKDYKPKPNFDFEIDISQPVHRLPIHLLQNSRYGYINPVSTPEGENCGIIKSLSLVYSNKN